MKKKKGFIIITLSLLSFFIILTSIIAYLVSDGVIILNSFYKSIVTPTSFRTEIEENKEYSFNKNGITYYYQNVFKENNKICFKENGKIYTKSSLIIRIVKFSNNLEFNIYFYAFEDNSLKSNFASGKEDYSYYFGLIEEPSEDYFKNYTICLEIDNVTENNVYVDRLEFCN